MPAADRLLRGQYFGHREHHREVGGLALSLLEPTVPEREVERHEHEGAHFILVLEGLYVSTAHGAPEVAAAPFLVYNPPGTVHRDRFRSERGRFFALAVDTATLDLAAQVGHLPSEPRAVGPRGLALARRLARESRRLGDDFAVEAHTLELLTTLDREGRGAPGSSRSSPAWLLRARDLLRDEASTPRGVRDVAARVGVHPVHLAREFRRHFDQSPADYLRYCRVERAVALLSQTSAPLSQIALDCGFADQSHFTKAFRRVFGEPPATFRRLRTR